MYFTVGLPKILRKCGSILVIVDLLTKLTHFIPVRVDYNVVKLAKIFVKAIVRLHRVPIAIMSGTSTLFTSIFWEMF